jgi:hypothetical protein
MFRTTPIAEPEQNYKAKKCAQSWQIAKRKFVNP